MKKAHRIKLSKMVRQIALSRDKRCLRCGKDKNLHVSHIYPRGKHPRLQFELDNVKVLCMACHLYWWHKHPIEAKEWAEQTLGRERLDSLKEKANTIKYGSYIYEEIKNDLTKIIEEDL